MKINQLGAQLYTLRDYLKSPKDIAQALQKVRQIGYEAVQVSGMAAIDEGELVKILDEQGLICAATHEPGDTILNNPQKVVERLAKLRCKYTAYPFPAGINMSSKSSVLDFAAKLNAAGKTLYEAGMVLTYHNHSIEFQRIEGKLIIDMIYDNTDPLYVQGEIDTYWVQHGGGNPAQWCQKLQDRLPLLHLKDYIITNGNVPTYAEIGSGNLDWQQIIPAAQKAGCQWYLVEQDVCPGSPFDSLQKSFCYVKEKIAK